MNITRISATEYVNTDGKRVTVDLRTAAEYENECLHDCIALPVQELTPGNFKDALTNIEHHSGPVYLLCQSGKRAEIAIDKLQGHADHELIIIEGGLNALKAAGIETKQGARKTISLERQVRIAAGTLTVTGVILGFSIHPGFFGISAFVGAGLMFAGITDTCGMAMMLAQMPWNKASKA